MFVQTLPNYQIIYGGSLFQIQSYRLGVKSSPSAGLQLFLRENVIAYFPRDPPRNKHQFPPDSVIPVPPFFAIPENRRNPAQFERPKQHMDSDRRQVVQGSPRHWETSCVETPNVNSQTGTPSNHSTPVVHTSASATPLAMGRGDLGDSMFNSLWAKRRIV